MIEFKYELWPSTTDTMELPPNKSERRIDTETLKFRNLSFVSDSFDMSGASTKDSLKC